MKSKPAASRSLLRRLAEPVPRSAALLIPRRPVGDRGAGVRPGLDAIPQIIDVVGTGNNASAESQQRQPANPGVPDLPPKRMAARARVESSQGNATIRPKGVPNQPARKSFDTPGETILQSTLREHKGAETKSPPTATHDNAQLRTMPGRPVSAEAPVRLAPVPIVAQAEKRQGIRVHIGTIEVRVPAPPAPMPQAAAAAAPNLRNSMNAAPSRSSAPLSRSLAWSQGLVQG